MSFARASRNAPMRAGESAMGAIRGGGAAEFGRSISWLNPAWLTLIASLGLCAVGLHSIGLTTGVDGVDQQGLVSRQFVFVVLGLLVFAGATVVHYKTLGRLTPVFAVITLGLLVVVIAPAVPESLVTPRNGARRWINLGVADFQPSELAKIVYVLAVAWYLRFRKNHRRLLGLAAPAVITFIPMALILVEPDLGTALLFLPCLFAMLVAAGAKLKHLILVTVVAAALAPAMYPLLQPHQKARIQALVNQFKGDTSKNDGINYQGDRATTLIGAGGVAGLGAERARAYVDFNQLPEDHNDMIFAVVGARFGFLGAVGLVGLYGLWLLGAVLTAAWCKDPFGRLLCVGLTAMIATQTLVNLGENVGVLPITGTTLPFVSYGGSSLLIGFLMAGLIANVGLRPPERMSRKSFEFGEDDEDA